MFLLHVLSRLCRTSSAEQFFPSPPSTGTFFSQNQRVGGQSSLEVTRPRAGLPHQELCVLGAEKGTTARKHLWEKNSAIKGFPGGSVVKNPFANTGNTGLIPDLGRSYMLWSNY